VNEEAAMATALKLGRADHGRKLTLEDFQEADYVEGHKYEIIHGRLYVSPLPAFSADDLKEWILDLLKEYARAHMDVINYVTTGARVFVPDGGEVTAPEPDIACYQGLPTRGRRRGVIWERISPVLVVEIISPDDPGKDLTRNPPLYLAVPSIREYWVFDPRPDPYAPSLVVHRRQGRRWRIIDVPHGGTYTTRLLPGFSLTVDPFPDEE
jgi:Uma2 family endonuclease